MTTNTYIQDLLAGRWTDSLSAKTIQAPIQAIIIDDTLDGQEPDLIAPLKLGSRLALVSDTNTYEALGRRVAQALAANTKIDNIILREAHADSDSVDDLRTKTRHADALIAVGSGTINDLCKYATFLDQRRYAVFCSAASMNGYTSSTASITVAGLKSSLPAHMPAGIFMDLGVIAAAPAYLARSGLGDSLCRSTAQFDCWLGHRLLGNRYHPDPFAMQADDETDMLARAGGVNHGAIEFYRSLCRVLILCGLGSCLTGTSEHASMSEHLISHYIDMCAAHRHPGSLHGQQVGVAALSMNRLQHQLITNPEPPYLQPTLIDKSAILKRYGTHIGGKCLAEFKAKALDQQRANALNKKLTKIWPELCQELRALMLPLQRMIEVMQNAGVAMSAEAISLDSEFYREAIVHAREIRNRFSVLDIAGDAGLLELFAASQK